MSGRVPFAATLLVAALALGPAAAAGQLACGVRGAEVGVEAGLVRYAMGGGASGLELAAGAGFGTERVAARVSAGVVDLNDSQLDPTVVRGAVGVPIGEMGEWGVCVTGDAGLSWFGDFQDDASVIAGGGGVSLARPFRLGPAAAVLSLEGRALAASATGSMLGLTISATGLSLGAAAGVAAAFGPAVIRLVASADGFATGLGPTPYPHQAIRLSAALRF